MGLGVKHIKAIGLESLLGYIPDGNAQNASNPRILPPGTRGKPQHE
jgi:hypothetical protein